MEILDLFCGAGGAGAGLARALPAATVLGVDIAPRPRYPLAGAGMRFRQADALQVLDDLVAGRVRADFVWASPPCQGYSRLRFVPGRQESSSAYPKLLEQVRAGLRAWGGAYAIENVPLAPMADDAITLCGTMFTGLRVYRHRKVECSVPLLQPFHPRHVEKIGDGTLSRYSKPSGTPGFITVAGHLYALADGKRAMGIDWDIRKDELSESIPPAYAEYVLRTLVAAGALGQGVRA